MSPEAIEWLERDYDQLVPLPPYQMGDDLVSHRYPGWQVGSNVVRPMFEIIHDIPPLVRL